MSLHNLVPHNPIADVLNSLSLDGLLNLDQVKKVMENTFRAPSALLKYPAEELNRISQALSSIADTTMKHHQKYKEYLTDKQLGIALFLISKDISLAKKAIMVKNEVTKENQWYKFLSNLATRLTSALSADSGSTLAKTLDSTVSSVPPLDLKEVHIEHLLTEFAQNKDKFKLRKLTDAQIQKHLDTAWNAYLKTEPKEFVLEKADLLAARIYSTEPPTIYGLVNGFLRDFVDSNKHATSYASLNDWRHFYYHLSRAIDNLPGSEADEQILYRGQTFIPPDIQDWTNGTVIVWPAFSSCSLDREVSEAFAQGGVFFTIKVAKGYGGNLTPYSVFPVENEVLLPAFSSFVVLSCVSVKGQRAKWLVELECIGAHPCGSCDRLDPEKMNKCFEAAKDGNLVQLINFINQDNINQPNQENETLLIVASRAGHVAIVDWLIKRGANVNARSSDGSTPLHVAAALDHYEIVEELFKGKASPDIKNNSGLLPAQNASGKKCDFLFQKYCPAATQEKNNTSQGLVGGLTQKVGNVTNFVKVPKKFF